MPRTIHVVDDDPAVRESVVELLDAEGLKTRTYADAADFVARAACIASGCVITDLRMPGMTGLELLEHLQPRRESFRVIVLTGRGDVTAAVEALKGGAVDFIEKPILPDVLVAAVRAAQADLEGKLGAVRERQDYASRLASLTDRESEVLDRLVDGDSSKEAALALGISPRTAESYRANIMLKMRVDSLAQLVRTVMIAKGAS
jgi:two-component system response regulator FixJ